MFYENHSVTMTFITYMHQNRARHFLPPTPVLMNRPVCVFYFNFYSGISMFGLLNVISHSVYSLRYSSSLSSSLTKSRPVTQGAQLLLDNKIICRRSLFSLRGQWSRRINMLMTMMLHSTLLLNINPQAFYNYTNKVYLTVCKLLVYFFLASGG